MKFFVSELQNRYTMFFSEADSYTLLTQQVTMEELVRNMKLASLLYDHIILAGAYIWQSQLVYHCILRLEPLVRNGDILLSIRDPRITRDFADYFDRRVKETSMLIRSPISCFPELMSEIAKPEQRPIALELDEIGTLLYRDIHSVERIFRSLWLDDTLDQNNPNSLYNLLSLSLPLEHRRVVLESIRIIAKEAYFSRGLIAKHVIGLRIPEDIKKAIIQRASDLYLLSNAMACESDLLVTHRTLAYPGYRKAILGPLARSNVELFLKVLQLCGISPSVIDSLNAKELLLLKASPEFRAFRETYFRLINSIKMEEEDFISRVLKRFSSMRREEALRKRLLQFLKYIENASSLFFAAALGVLIQEYSPFYVYLLAGSGVGAIVSHFLRKIERLQNTPILNFENYRVLQEYRNRLRLLLPCAGSA